LLIDPIIDQEVYGAIEMRISVFGTGYVGAVTAACLANDGHEVVAVDRIASKVNALNLGLAPIVEPGLDAMLSRNVANGRLHATMNAAEALAMTDMSIVCVGTPSRPNGELDLTHIIDVTEEIGSALANKNAFHSLVYRSTMLPGSMRDVVKPTLRGSLGSATHENIGLAYYPEFLRESTAIADYHAPGLMIAGADDERVAMQLQELTNALDCPKIMTDIETAETVKYVANSWHALKIGFANEIGNFCSGSGVDGHRVMDAICADRRLNISSAYMKPGMAYGGSCLPKDLRALRWRADAIGVHTPILDALHISNQAQIERAVELVMQQGQRKVSMLGLSFKPGTDDLRESPLVEVAERLYGKGCDLRIYDKAVRYAALNGTNLDYIRARIPHLAATMDDCLDTVVSHGDVLVIGHAVPEFRDQIARLGPDKKVVDFVRVNADARTNAKGYVGLCW